MVCPATTTTTTTTNRLWIIDSFSYGATVNLNPAELSEVVSMYVRYFLSSVFGSGLLSRLLLSRFSPTCSGVIGFRVGGLVVFGRFVVILSWFQFCS